MFQIQTFAQMYSTIWKKMFLSAIFFATFQFCRSHYDGAFPYNCHYLLFLNTVYGALLRIASCAIRSRALYNGSVSVEDMPYSVQFLYGAGLRIKTILRSSHRPLWFSIAIIYMSYQASQLSCMLPLSINIQLAIFHHVGYLPQLYPTMKYSLSCYLSILKNCRLFVNLGR